ncbi:transcription factor grauzone-like [Ochlerotatus camptorhynchus]|uniref:transcription factor grauzone-like n=1 Tax=Ochlerotatus camptorhynchus TaxID=644619 RepID=UPI0031DD86E5
MKTQQDRNEEDQLFNKHFRMICDLCGTSAATFTILRSHFWKEHKRRDGYVVCCNKKLSKRYTILDHIDFHANPDVFRCEVCGKKYKNKDTLNAHTLCRHSSEDQRPFKCDLCPQSFAQKSALALHMERHVKVKCPQCKKMFACNSTLSIHMTNQHSGKDRTMVCDTCGQEFLSKQCFDRHMNEHMGIEVQRFQCGICQRWLKGERNFRNHMNWVHTDGDREFQCDICLQKYPHSRALQCHKLQTHAEPKHECEFCGKKFKKAIALKEHRTTHTGEVLYACEHCGIPNNCKANLYQHIKRQHPTEWAQKKLKATQKSGSS